MPLKNFNDLEKHIVLTEEEREWREDGGRMEGRWKMTEEVTDCN